ncbi:hypothetical protein [Eubacterium sp.]|uniref:hypothetical protein n=1 Tax=Eubacterium sp. TaxID=142586 RepID=UPI0025F681BE|nr:hypothetical protein [Eubacterium sp.]MCR5628170.1 hypothetical protein [Eubacterium sp.]
MANKVANVVKPIVDPIVKTFNYVTEKVEGLPTWAKVGIGVIGATIAITTGVGATYVATTMAKSAISGAIFNGAIYGVSSLVTGHFDKTEFINSMLHGAADMFMVSGVMLGAKGVVDCVARNSGRIREAMLANEEGSTNAVDKLDDFYESRVRGKTSYGKSSENVVKTSYGKSRGSSVYQGERESREVFLPTEKTHELARNTLVKELDATGALKDGSQKYYGRLQSDYGYGKQIGTQSLAGKVRWRLDYDEKIGVHYNIEDFLKGRE